MNRDYKVGFWGFRFNPGLTGIAQTAKMDKNQRVGLTLPQFLMTDVGYEPITKERRLPSGLVSYPNP